MSQQEETIKALLLESGLFELPEGDDASQTSLVEYGLDSLVVVLFISKIEKEFGVKVNTESFDIDHFSTLAKIQSYISRLVEEQ